MGFGKEKEEAAEEEYERLTTPNLVNVNNGSCLVLS